MVPSVNDISMPQSISLSRGGDFSSQKKTAAGTRALKLEEGEEVVFADSFDAKEKVFAEVQGRKIELSKLTKKKRDAKPEQVK